MGRRESGKKENFTLSQFLLGPSNRSHTLLSRICWHVIFKRTHRVENPTKYRADDFVLAWCANIFCWMFGDPHFFSGISLPFLILSILLKIEKKSVRGKFLFILIYYSNRVKLVHGYRCAWLRSCIFLRLILPDLMTYVAKIYQIGLHVLC